MKISHVSSVFVKKATLILSVQSGLKLELKRR